MRLAIVAVMAFALAATCSYAQTGLVAAEDALVANAISQFRGVITSNRLQEVAVWKIEEDSKGLVNVKALSTKLNFALMDNGFLIDQAFDFTDVEDRDELKRLASIYEMRAFVYGRRTVVEGGTIRVSFQIFDSRSQAIIWEGLISSEKPAPTELATVLFYGKWVSLGTGVATGVGSITALALYFDADRRYNSRPCPPTSDLAKIRQEMDTYLGLSIGLGITSAVSGGVAAYLFLTDQGNLVSQAGFYSPDSPSAIHSWEVRGEGESGRVRKARPETTDLSLQREEVEE